MIKIMNKKQIFGIVAVVVIVGLSVWNMRINKSLLKATTMANVETVTEVSGDKNRHYLNGVQRNFVAKEVKIATSVVVSNEISIGGIYVGVHRIMKPITCCVPTTSDMNGCNFDMEDTRCIQHVIYTK
jgi:hypothetical protein